MTAILNVSVPAAGTYVGPLWQLREPAGAQPVIEVQANFVFGSGAATTLNLYLQTSFDGGTNWCDVISFSQFTTASARVGAAVIQGAVTPVALTDATLAAGTATPASNAARTMRLLFVTSDLFFFKQKTAYEMRT